MILDKIKHGGLTAGVAFLLVSNNVPWPVSSAEVAFSYSNHSLSNSKSFRQISAASLWIVENPKDRQKRPELVPSWSVLFAAARILLSLTPTTRVFQHCNDVEELVSNHIACSLKGHRSGLKGIEVGSAGIGFPHAYVSGPASLQVSVLLRNTEVSSHPQNAPQPLLNLSSLRIRLIYSLFPCLLCLRPLFGVLEHFNRTTIYDCVSASASVSASLFHRASSDC